MDEKLIQEAYNDMIVNANKDVFGETTEFIDKTESKKISRGSFVLALTKVESQNKWEVHLNNHLLATDLSKERASELYDQLLFAYNLGFSEGLEKGGKLGTEDYPDALSLGLAIQNIEDE